MHPTIAPIVHRVSKWVGVATEQTDEGVRFRIDDRELARLSTSGLTVPTTYALRNQLLTDGLADSVPNRHDRVRYRVRSAADVPGAIRLLRVAYVYNQGTASPVRLDGTTDHIRRLEASAELLALLSVPTADTARDGRPA